MMDQAPPLIVWRTDWNDDSHAGNSLMARSGAALPPPRPGDLHLWRIHADAELPDLQARCQRTLSAAELARGQRLRMPNLRRRFLLSHYACRRIFGAYLGCAPEAIDFSYSATGKPRISAPVIRAGSEIGSGAGSGIEFNLSTTGDLTLLALRWQEPLGVDAEILCERGDTLGIARRMFGEAEAERLSRLQGEARLLAFYAAWTALEARVKRDGRGLPGHRQADAPEITVAHARPRGDAICAIAGRALPPLGDWITREWIAQDWPDLQDWPTISGRPALEVY
ncbi:4'-phosphopantetheinyl transferase family protein [Thiorhodovibrio frisius]|uniref:Phosphopantetheinyl transferase n=1 Tax=Thiorhodovibrio frisius TaxID=631362 RepID=H8YX21_9GAMM|nr:4'-phosphopantetheinyl transferase superfamily protein [Thiorhodovibrio frisius]EIC22997.1 phosphopantetheinyl transferase [Thiorhodovibrio frisius]WPL22735.1 holo-(acyl carrier protein) synthase 2 [Thiorhodovibrio frisius]